LWVGSKGRKTLNQISLRLLRAGKCFMAQRLIWVGHDPEFCGHWAADS
jgi:hypothetical protein